MYSYKFETENKIKNLVKCKGSKKNVINNTISIDNLKKCLFEGKEEYREMSYIRSYKR